jgi:hypothetical protein
MGPPPTCSPLDRTHSPTSVHIDLSPLRRLKLALTSTEYPVESK